MSNVAPTSAEPFVDRRSYDTSQTGVKSERRQFTNSHDGLSPEARELAQAVDAYKLHHRRRFINFEELHGVFVSLGYHK